MTTIDANDLVAALIAQREAAATEAAHLKAALNGALRRIAELEDNGKAKNAGAGAPDGSAG